ncbi:hypothetical protein QUF58_12080, partial [Anaerolineales bacterium HSG24]|nr:hypothetical protein [Anaerolineales bacterium HSG24]
WMSERVVNGVQTFSPLSNSPQKGKNESTSLPLGGIEGLKVWTPVLITSLMTMLLVVLLIRPQIENNINWLTHKWGWEMHDAWSDALNHPLEPSAGLLAEWADLTSFWYLQHAEQQRPDLRGIYPPNVETVESYLQTERPLYIAGLLDPTQPDRAWVAEMENRYQLLPWGRLVRLAPLASNPQTLLPTLPHPIEQSFGEKLHLIGADFPSDEQTLKVSKTFRVLNSDFPVTLTWQTLTDLPPETTISLRLTAGDRIVAQLDDSLVSGWFPHQNLAANQYLLSYAPIPIPVGTLPGRYRLQLVVYRHHSQPWPLPDGGHVLDLAEVKLTSPTVPPAWVNRYDFNNELVLFNYEYSVRRVGQGKGFALRMIWQARQQPVDNYRLQAELVDQSGAVLRQVEQSPDLPTSAWLTGQFVRNQVDLVLPASTPLGQEAIRVRLRWFRPDGSALSSRYWLLPLSDYLDLKSLDVTEKKRRVFEPPPIEHVVSANFDNRLRLLGYNLLTEHDPHINLNDCPEPCQLDLELYWQGIEEMAELYTVFLHLVDNEGNLVAQQDKIPGIRGKQPTTGWLPDEIITDPISLNLPADIQPGRYRLRVGLYLPSLNNQRLPVLDANQDGFVEFGQIGLER